MMFIRQILKMTPLGEDLSWRSAFKSTAFRLQGKTRRKPWPWKTNLIFLVRMCLLVWTIPLRLRRAKSAVAIMYNDGGTRARRLYYFKKYAQLDCADDQVLSCHPEGIGGKLYFKELGMRKVGLVLRIGLMLQWAAFVACFKRTRVNPHWKIRFAQLLLQQVLFHRPGRQQLLYFCYEPETYFSSFVAAALLGDYVPQIVSSNSVLFRDNRYLYHPKLQLRICSKFQIEETKSYLQRGWMQVGNVTYWGPEEAIVFDQLPKVAPTYDIGIYSSAGWARTHDLWRSEDLELLRRGGYPDNPIFVQLMQIIHIAVACKKAYGASVKLYLHPHEIHLIKDHDIRPPYLDFLEKNGIVYELDGKSTIENIYEARIGLAVLSTLLFDRLNFDLTSYYYTGAGIKDYNIDARFLGSYQRFGYGDSAELRKKLDGEFGGNLLEG